MKPSGQKPSKNVYRQLKGPFQSGTMKADKSARRDVPQGNGKSDRIYDSPEFKQALKSISTDYQKSIKRKP